MRRELPRDACSTRCGLFPPLSSVPGAKRGDALSLSSDPTSELRHGLGRKGLFEAKELCY